MFQWLYNKIFQGAYFIFQFGICECFPPQFNYIFYLNWFFYHKALDSLFYEIWWKDSCPLKFHFIKRFSSMHFLSLFKTFIYIDWGTFQCIGIFQTSGFLSHSELSLYHLHTCIVIWKDWCVFSKLISIL